MSQDLTLVPPARLGALLAHKRIEGGLLLDDVAATDSPFDAHQLRRIERGQTRLSDVELRAVMEVYGLQENDSLPDRARLVIDLNEGTLWAGPEIADLPTNADIDQVLGRYVGLLYLLRNMEPGSALPLRTEDLDVLGESLRRSVRDVEQRLFGLMLPNQATPWLERLRHRLTVPAAGLLVGMTAVGSLVLVPFPSAADAPQLAAASSAPTTVLQNAVDLGPAEVGSGLVALPSTVAWDSSIPASVGAAAEQMISYNWQGVLIGWSVEYLPPRPGYRGNTNTQSRHIEIYVSEGDTPTDVVQVLAHEIGHAIDVTFLTDAERRSWMDARNLDGIWWPESGRADFSVGAGDFAEGVARYLVNSPSDSTHGEFTAQQLAIVEALLPR